MAYDKYLIRPLKDGLIQDIPSLYSSPTALEWPAKNFRTYQNSVKKRQGYLEDRNLGSGVSIQAIAVFQLSTGGRSTIYLTNTNACKRQGSGTWSYITETYTTGSVSSIIGTAVIGSSTLWSANAAAGDFFILDSDHSSSDEPDSNWAKIESVGGNTTITLVDTYYGTVNQDISSESSTTASLTVTSP